MGATPSGGISLEKPPAALKTGHSGSGAAKFERKATGLGLPCAKCRTYYPADSQACPVCQSSERVLVTAIQTPAPIAPGEQLRDLALLEQERERFLRDFKAQLVTLHIAAKPAASSHCVKEENHPSGAASAAICQDCYERLQERVDVLEAVLHMNLTEATQIVYDAVWADPSDPHNTYENAANALLRELRRRSGVPHTFALQRAPMAD